jgi:hypothetical protein
MNKTASVPTSWHIVSYNLTSITIRSKILTQSIHKLLFSYKLVKKKKKLLKEVLACKYRNCNIFFMNLLRVMREMQVKNILVTAEVVSMSKKSRGCVVIVLLELPCCHDVSQNGGISQC